MTNSGTQVHLLDKMGLLARSGHRCASCQCGELFVDFVRGKEGQLLIKNLGRVISRADIPQDDFARFKTIAEDISIADRINQVIEE
jgi:hypothetical protein